MASAMRGVGKVGMPLVNRELAGHESGFRVVAAVEDFAQISFVVIGRGREAEVIEDGQVDVGQAFEET